MFDVFGSRTCWVAANVALSHWATKSAPLNTSPNFEELLRGEGKWGKWEGRKGTDKMGEYPPSPRNKFDVIVQLR